MRQIVPGNSRVRQVKAAKRQKEARAIAQHDAAMSQLRQVPRNSSAGASPDVRAGMLQAMRSIKPVGR